MAKASTLFEIMSKDKVDPDEMMFHMNNDLYQTKTAGMFVTCILGEYDLVSEEIRWVNAGHQPALVRSYDGNYSEFASSSTPLGVIKHKDKNVYKLEKTNLSSSRFYIFTDGLSESLDKNGEEIGINGSIKIIENNFNSDLKKQLKDVTNDVIKVAGDKNPSDDLTLVGLGN